MTSFIYPYAGSSPKRPQSAYSTHSSTIRRVCPSPDSLTEALDLGFANQSTPPQKHQIGETPTRRPPRRPKPKIPRARSQPPLPSTSLQVRKHTPTRIPRPVGSSTAAALKRSHAACISPRKHSLPRKYRHFAAPRSTSAILAEFPLPPGASAVPVPRMSRSPSSESTLADDVPSLPSLPSSDLPLPSPELPQPVPQTPVVTNPNTRVVRTKAPAMQRGIPFECQAASPPRAWRLLPDEQQRRLGLDPEKSKERELKLEKEKEKARQKEKEKEKEKRKAEKEKRKTLTTFWPRKLQNMLPHRETDGNAAGGRGRGQAPVPGAGPLTSHPVYAKQTQHSDAILPVPASVHTAGGVQLSPHISSKTKKTGSKKVQNHNDKPAFSTPGRDELERKMGAWDEFRAGDEQAFQVRRVELGRQKRELKWGCCSVM